ncbi:MAG: HAMP domain-containing histidine kinase [Rhodoluna sp.]|nr:HAMP domain-containing histidine kinase [Rhodoluna sp.]
MKLITKVSLSAVAVFSIALIGGGYAMVELNHASELRRTEKVLDEAALRIATSADTLSTALVVADEIDTPLTMAFVDMDRNITTLTESSVSIDVAPAAKVLKSASTEAVIVSGETEYQLRAVAMGDNEYLLVATSTESAQLARLSNLSMLILVSAITIALAGAAITVLIRRDLKSVIKTLAGTADQERETRESMQSFMGDASHELRTPLTVIKGYAELLAKSGAKTTAEQRERAYGRIVEQVNRMDDTITGLLQLAEVGSVSSNTFSRVELAPLVAAAAEDLQATSPKRKIDTQLAQLGVLGSAELLRRLLDNATGNIMRHTSSQDAVRLTLAAERKVAVLTIEDAGKGLPADAYAKGVQGFRRFDESRSRETGGTGLGMTLMKSIVEAHGGDLAIGPSELGGLKLEIRLPLN